MTTSLLLGAAVGLLLLALGCLTQLGDAAIGGAA
jgi:hypothetical protein